MCYTYRVSTGNQETNYKLRLFVSELFSQSQELKNRKTDTQIVYDSIL